MDLKQLGYYLFMESQEKKKKSGNDDGDGKKQNDAVGGERATQTRTLFEK